MTDKIAFLNYIAYQLRIDVLKATTAAGSGHPTSCLSAADLVAALFMDAMHFDPHNPANPSNDRFILSKGHAAPLLYAIWKQLGIVSAHDLMHMRHFDSVLEGHPTPRFSRAEAATGSLGMGLSIGVGMALSSRITNIPFHVYVLMGDSEIAEGSVWEAAEIAAYYKLHNVIGIVDVNRLGQTGPTMTAYDLASLAERFKAFGWQTHCIDGHNMTAIVEALATCRAASDDKPQIILARTTKGYGVDQWEDQEGYHGRVLTAQELPGVLEAMHARFAQEAHYKGVHTLTPAVPSVSADEVVEHAKPLIPLHALYKIGDMVAPREAYGHALTALGDVYQNLVSLDAEVKNSTFAQTFEAKYPHRFIQCFVAEQNMVSMGVGCAARGLIPFISTFGSFLTRAFDQLRMAAIGKSPLRVVGTHVGVSVGYDGPSQMALEDIAMMRSLPESIILYPSDAASTYQLVQHAAAYNNGISYVRLTREALPVLYTADEQFPIGKCKVLKRSDHDVACVVAAGITVHEALKAYQMLQRQHVSIAVIDLYSVKPLDEQTLIEVGTQAGGRIITVEDHYREGGLGEAVVYALRNTTLSIECLAVTQLPRSGKPSDLLAYEHIDAAAIVHAVTE